ncbi:MAG: hypothetical protein NXI00_20070 [Cytophagales bacterium]|nr:hypothetical protein [Cytophagales bacterium]
MEKKKNNSKKYKLDTLQQMMNVVNKDNLDCFIADFKSWFEIYLDQVNLLKELLPKGVADGLPNSEIVNCEFIWVDDGKNDLLHATIQNPITGEITDIYINGKEKQ